MIRHKSIVILFIFAILLRLIYFLTIPLGQAPDEIVHFRQIYEKALSWKFPLEYPQKNIGFISRYPPFYYYFGATILYPLISNPVSALPEAFIQFGLILRFTNLIISLITLYLTTKLIIILYPRLTLIALPILYFWPQWTTSSIWINMDPLFLLLMVIIIYLCIKFLTKPYKHSYPIILGVLTGLTLLTKPLAPALCFGVLIGILISKSWQRKKLKALIVYLAVTFAVTGWYYMSNFFSTGSILASDLVKNELAIYTRPFSFPFYPLGVLWWTFQTFVASFGPTNNIRLAEVVYIVISILIMWLAIFSLRKFDGLKRLLIKNNKQKLFMSIISVTLIFSLSQFFYINFFISFQPQGRYLFPLYLLYPILLASVLLTFLRAQGRALSSQLLKVIPLILTIILITFNLWSLHCISSKYWKLSLFPLETGCVYHRVRLTPWQEEIIFNK